VAKRTALTVALTLLAVTAVGGAYLAGRASRTTTSTSAPASAAASLPATTALRAESPDLMGGTDPDPTHWAPSQQQASQRIQVRLFDSEPAVVPDFPLTMNGCGTRQLRVAWRVIGAPIVAGIAPYLIRGEPVVLEQSLADTRTSGTMWLSGCEQPAFIGPGNIDDMVVEVTVFELAVGHG
jgi:hypothetical protein